jgi:hypothetical protein
MGLNGVEGDGRSDERKIQVREERVRERDREGSRKCGANSMVEEAVDTKLSDVSLS